MENTATQTEPQKTYFSRDLYQEVTDTIIQKLEAGTVPWQAPYINAFQQNYLGLPKNIATNKHYQGINIVLLWSASIDNEYTSTEWATFKQWTEKKEFIRKGEKGSTIVYYDTFEKVVDGETQKIPFLKASVVFNRCQLRSFNKNVATYDYSLPGFAESIEMVDEFIANTNAKIEYNSNRACYVPLTDTIHIPKRGNFINTVGGTASENYYSTLLHELVHWSGSPARLNRVKGKMFGDDQYAYEELVAELGAAFLSSEFYISSSNHEDHASYIDHWLGILKKNKHMLLSAASEASKAVGYLKELQPS